MVSELYPEQRDTHLKQGHLEGASDAGKQAANAALLGVLVASSADD
jgi:hypothetical protein